MSLSRHIVMIESEDGSSEELAARIRQLGIDPIVVESFDDVRALLVDRSRIISSLLVPTNLPAGITHRELKRTLRELSRSGASGGLVLVSVGKAPSPAERKKLRSAGLELALWEPFDDGSLRFQINRAVSGDGDEHGRRSVRVPTYLFARVYVGGRTKDAIIYSLSEGGAFLETPRASMNRVELDVEVRLPGKPIMLKAVVIFSNVPGNLQRPNLPMGMGVRFEGLSRDEIKVIRTYVNERLAQLSV